MRVYCGHKIPQLRLIYGFISKVEIQIRIDIYVMTCEFMTQREFGWMSRLQDLCGKLSKWVCLR